MRLKPLAADGLRRCTPLVCFLASLTWMCGCSASQWRQRVLYSRGGTVLYAENQEKDGREVPQGYLHPVEVTTETMSAILRQMVYKYRPLIGANEDLLLFDEAQIAELSEPLQLALGGLTPNQRLRFLVMRDSWASMLTGSKATSGVMFMEKGGVLNVALDRIRESVQVGEGGDPADVSFPYDPTEYRRADPLIPFRGTKLHVDTKTSKKFPRWLEVDLSAVKNPTPPIQATEKTPEAPAAVVAAGTTVAGTTAATTKESSEPGQSPLPTPPPAAQKDEDEEVETEEERYSRLKEKLETLKRLKAEGVVTEEEYQQQFEKIMSEL